MPRLEYMIKAEHSTDELVCRKQSQYTMKELYMALTVRAQRPEDTHVDFVFYMFVDDGYCGFKPYKFTLCVRERASQPLVHPCMYSNPVFSASAAIALRSGYTVNVAHIMTLLTKEEGRSFHELVSSLRSRPKNNDSELLLQWMEETIMARTSRSLMDHLRQSASRAASRSDDAESVVEREAGPVVKRPRSESPERE